MTIWMQLAIMLTLVEMTRNSPQERAGQAISAIRPRLVYRFSGPATPIIVRRVLEDLCRHLSNPDLPTLDLTSIQIVVSEILNNIVEHGYQEEGQGVFSIHVHIGPGHILAGFSDFGSPMPGHVLEPLQLAKPDQEFADLPEGKGKRMKSLYKKIMELTRLIRAINVGNL